LTENLHAAVVGGAAATERQQRAAAGLVRLGLAPGDRFAIVSTNHVDVVVVALAALRIGVVPVMINPALPPETAAELLRDADVRRVVGAPELTELTRHRGSIELAPHPLARPMHFTSGTTGHPKGVWTGLLSATDAAALAAEEIELWQLDASDVHLVCGPLYHSAPLRFAMMTLLVGATIAAAPKFDARSAARLVTDLSVSTTFMAPVHLQRLRALDEPARLSSLRLLAHAGAPCPVGLKRWAIDRLGDAVWEFYGSTEGQFTVCSAAEWTARPGTCGRARPNRMVSADENGVLWCAVPDYARFEYWNAPEKTRTSWRGNAFTCHDLGRVDDEGYVYLEGRRDDLIISGGVNVYPAEVERVLESLDGVESAVVFGVEDDEWGQRVGAAFVGDAEPAALLVQARTRLAPHQIPRVLVPVDEIPVSPSGKVRRSEVGRQLGVE
jgi:acyl-CoA synthetase (AMP-forming)/AMP-acid ligase II